MNLPSQVGSTLTVFLILFSALSASPKQGQAAYFTLPTLDTTMTDPIFKNLAGAFILRPVEPASDLGRIFGLSVGVGLSLIDQSSLSSVFTGAGTYLPSGDIQLGLGLPMGITFEAGVLPNVSLNGTAIGRYAGAIKWTLTRTLLAMLPFDMGIRASYTNSNLSYSQSLSPATVSVTYNSSVLGTQLLISKSLVFLEPFFGIGLVNHSSTLSGTGSANLFGSTFQAGTQSMSGSALSTWLQAGVLVKVLIFGIAAEYDSMYGFSSYSGKVSIRL